MAFTNSQIAAAKDELDKDKRQYFCVECGRPRTNMYCPWNSQHPTEFKHVVMSRKFIGTDHQITFFLSNNKSEHTKHVFKEG